VWARGRCTFRRGTAATRRHTRQQRRPSHRAKTHFRTSSHALHVYVPARAGYKRFVDLGSALAERLPGLRASQNNADLAAAARDLWPRGLIETQSGEAPANRPAAVVWPENSAQIAAVLEFARREGYRIVPFGAGSGVCGGIFPDARTIVVDTKRLLELRIDESAPVVRAGAGVLGSDLEAALEKRGYTVGHFPSSIICSTVGGWVAARGAGQCSSRYGKIEDMVAGLECVLGTGDLVSMRRRRSAPDLVPLMTGSEGTLGFITEVALRLHPAPRARRFLSYSCRSIEHGFELLRTLLQAGLRPEVARLYDPIDSVLLGQSSDAQKSPKNRGELLGKAFAAAARRALARPRLLQQTIRALEGNVLGGATLILIFEGTEIEANEDAARAALLCARAGARSLGESRARAWLAHRYSVSFRQQSAFRLGAFTDTMEVAAPWSKLEAVYNDVRAALSEHALVMAHLSHAYPDGCSIYFTFSALGALAGEAPARYDAAWRTGLAAALAAGANLSHHHGVGRSKAARLAAELGQGTEMLNRLRNAWDPAALFDPETLRAPFEVESARAHASRPPLELDALSQLAEVDAKLTLGTLESLLAIHGFTLALQHDVDWSLTVTDYIARGFPGARDAFADPVASRVAGFEARAGGVAARVRPTPRRATGPDLLALFAGAQGQVGHVTRAHLVVARRGAAEARETPFIWDRDPPLNAGETHAFELVRRVFAR